MCERVPSSHWYATISLAAHKKRDARGGTQSSNQFALTFGNFGAYSSPTLSKPRVMQFSLRYSF